MTRTYFASLKTIAFALLVAFLCDAKAHSIAVHQNISDVAARSSQGLDIFLQDNFGLTFEASDLGLPLHFGIPMGPRSWIIEGSAREDDIDRPGDKGGKRSLDHFYDPFSHYGLTDVPFGLLFLHLGPNSFEWASKLNSPGFEAVQGPTQNEWSWQNARDYEQLAMTQVTKAARDENLAKMFRALGQVIHLAQDASQPQHVRNEQHLDRFPNAFPVVGGKPTPYDSPIEIYGYDNAKSLAYPLGALNWRSAEIKRLRDFWDRDFYTYTPMQALNRTLSPQALIDHEGSDTTKRLGLAEFTSGNFLGARSAYRELFPVGDIRFYPFPSLDGTNWRQISKNPSAYATAEDLPGGVTAHRFIVSKTANQGHPVAAHAAVTYFSSKFSKELRAPLRVSIDDPKVLSEYHSILIPKAIEYSAGILDYFFRGKISVSLLWDDVSQEYNLVVENQSGQDFSGGSFTLLQEDEAGERTAAQGFSANYSGNLADGDFIVATLAGPVAEVTKYILIYKGSIGTTDPVDENIAIAVTHFTLGCDYSVAGLRILDYATVIEQIVPPGSFSTSSALESCGFVDTSGGALYNLSPGAVNGQTPSYFQWFNSFSVYGIILQVGISQDGAAWPQFYGKPGGWDGNMAGTWSRSTTYPNPPDTHPPQWSGPSFIISATEE